MAAMPLVRAVDAVEVLAVVDNVVDLLIPSTKRARRRAAATLQTGHAPAVRAPLCAAEDAADTPVAEHGLSLLVSVRSGQRRRSVLFDTGSSVDGLVHNSRALGVDPAEVEAIVLSHGHFDHTMGLNGLTHWMQPLPPLVAHPDVWLKRRLAIPGREPRELPELSEQKVRAAGFRVMETRDPLPLLDGDLLVTGEIARTTDFERGFAVHESFREGAWRPDPLVQDDQALVAHVRGKGLVVITGCGHAGVINTLCYARQIAGVDRIFAVIGGFHLAGPPFEPLIGPTVEALAELEPEILAPMHCTGWRATHALAAALPEAFIPGSVGTLYVLEAESGRPA